MALSMEALASSAKLASSSSELRPYCFRFLSLSSPPIRTTLKPISFLRGSRNRPVLEVIQCSSEKSSGFTVQGTYSSQNSHNTFKIEPNSASDSPNTSTLLFPKGFKQWLVNVEAPPTGFSSKAQAVDFYVDILISVLGNERDAQMCVYSVSWQSNFGFCCMLDEESAQELTAAPGVLSVQPDEQFGSENKDNGDSRLFSNSPDSVETTEMSRTKLFVTGLSFYTSEKTLRSAFEPFGELVEVKIIMDKISRRSKGYAFVEYSTEEAATTALQEMNGKIINGWMIVVDRAKSKPNYNRGRPKSMSLRDRKLM